VDELPSKLLPVMEALSKGPIRDHLRHETYIREGIHESVKIDFPHDSTLELTFDGKEQCGVLRYWDEAGKPAGIEAFTAFDRVHEEFGKVRLWMSDTDAVLLATRYIERLYQLMSEME
jgi:hypothetical protein